MLLNVLEPTNGYLSRLIEFLSSDKKFYICIYDTSGILSNSLFSLPTPMRFHHSNFCSAVKTTSKGLQLCLECKGYCLKKASKSNSFFTGRCYMGITEIIRPVFINNKPACIIHLGNLLLKQDKEEIIKRAKKYSSIIGVPEELLLRNLETLDMIDDSDLQKYMGVIDLIHQSIIFAYTATYKQLKFKDKEETKSTNYILQSVLENVDRYYSLDIKLQHLARQYYINPNYLRNLFKKEMGTNFVDYLNRFRIEKACDLFSTGDSIINISTQVGFNNVTYFNKLFKKYKGCSPTQYRK